MIKKKSELNGARSLFWLVPRPTLGSSGLSIQITIFHFWRVYIMYSITASIGWFRKASVNRIPLTSRMPFQRPNGSCLPTNTRAHQLNEHWCETWTSFRHSMGWKKTLNSFHRIFFGERRPHFRMKMSMRQVICALADNLNHVSVFFAQAKCRAKKKNAFFKTFCTLIHPTWPISIGHFVHILLSLSLAATLCQY